MWTVDSVAIEHVVRDRVGFVEYHRIPVENRDIKVGNGASVEVLGKLVWRYLELVPTS